MYAFARVTVEMLTGALPRSKRGLDAILAKLSKPIQKALRRALDPVPKRRPKVAAIVKALRRRRRRMAWGLSIVAALALLVLYQTSSMPFRGSTAVAPPVSMPPVLVPPAQSPITCSDIAGVWNFETTVDELGTADRGLGAQGQYLLRLTAECTVESFRKTHWRNRAGRHVDWNSQVEVADLIHVQNISPDSLDFECQLRGRYEFSLRFRGQGVSGSFRLINRLGTTHWNGSLTGDIER